MNCTECERLIAGAGVTPASPAQQRDMAAHLTACPGCRRLQSALAGALESWRRDTAAAPIPDVAAAWRDLRPKLRRPGIHRRRLAPVLWLSVPLAAAAALALLVYQPAKAPVSDPGQLVRAELVEAGSTTASTMVYMDKDSGWLVVWAADNGHSG